MKVCIGISLAFFAVAGIIFAEARQCAKEERGSAMPLGAPLLMLAAGLAAIFGVCFALAAAWEHAR